MADFTECFRTGIGAFSYMNGLNAFAAEGGKKHIVVACPFAGVLARRESQQLIRGISPVSLLAAVDGAALLDEHLRTQGFGVRFPVLLHPESKVENAINGRKVFCDQWGLQHQSVFSFCHKCERAIGLIVSQDEVKAVKAELGQLYFWDGILD